MTIHHLRPYVLFTFVLMAAVTAASRRTIAAQEQPAPAPPSAAPAQPSVAEGEKTAEQVYKNIKVFKGVPASQILPAMRFIAASLGVRCNYCHVMGGPGHFDFAKDDKQPKLTARKMVLMMRAINDQNFHGRPVVTCASCHNGHTHPTPVPALAMANAGPPPPPPVFERMPLAAQVLDKYFAAIGGADAAQKVTTRVLKGTVTLGPNGSAPIEIYEKAPNKFLAVATTPRGAMERGYNGTTGWMSNPRGVRRAGGPEAAGLAQQADFYGNYDIVNLKSRYPRERVRGKEKIGDHEAYIMEAHGSSPAFERLYFDTESGLLLRVVEFTPTPVGDLPEQTDFDDYRDVNGVKVPFKVQQSSTEGVTTETFSDVSLNTPIDDSKFEMPTAQQ